MDKQQYILKLPLKQLTLLKFAIDLWKREDILASIREIRFEDETLTSIKIWGRKLMKAVESKVFKLLLPNSLQTELLLIILPVGLEMLRWMLHHRFLISSNPTDVLDQMCWTAQGSVDYRETAVRLIRQEQVDIVSSYKLACLYCLEDDIQAIWEKLSEDDKAYFYNKEDPEHFQRQYKLITFWTCSLNGDADIFKYLQNPRRHEPELSPFQNAFACVATSGNKAATEYFFQKLAFEEKEDSLLDIAVTVASKRRNNTFSPQDFPPENFPTVLFYLLSQMSKEKQLEFFTNHPEQILCFLDWPWQNLFMKFAELVWPFLSADNFQNILIRLSSISECRKLFREFFLLSPSHLRNDCLNTATDTDWIAILTQDDNNEILKFVLRNLDNEVKESFIISPFANFLWLTLMKNGSWSTMDLFIKECPLSDEAKTKMKESFEKEFADARGLSKREKKQLFRFFYDTSIPIFIANIKKELEEGMPHTSTKKSSKKRPKK